MARLGKLFIMVNKGLVARLGKVCIYMYIERLYIRIKTGKPIG